MSVLLFSYRESLPFLASPSFGAGLLPARTCSTCGKPLGLHCHGLAECLDCGRDAGPYVSDRDVLTGSPRFGLGIEPSPLTSRPGDRDACDQLWSIAFDLHKAGENPRMPGGLGRDEIKSWAFGEVAGKDARWSLYYDLGRQAGIDLERPSDCPASDFEAVHGWREGQTAASEIIAARELADVRHMATAAGHAWL